MKDFNKRLLYIFDQFQLNASSFADKIGVQRSSMSHILSGRNKPSLDFILKIYETFPEMSLTWLALGEGEIYKNINSTSTLNSKVMNDEIDIENQFPEMNFSEASIAASKIMDLNELENDNSETYNSNNIKDKFSLPILDSDSELEQILFIYRDGTFKSYRPK